ncbi:ESPR-type extended signal peptide-containing protein, partial [Paraburkholderia sp. J7]|uniref:ESPR-type extended signal peptide-containing protein n=1 Tax=Paraburkholderia sp. J7 TaxID=2805438 RepID=UPI002AB7E7A8
MNKSYRSIWNEATGAWVAVQENAVARGKKKSSRRALVALAAAGAGTAGFVLPGSAWADICASDSYGSKAGYRSIGTDTTCASWNGSTGDGEVPGAAQFTAIGLGGTQLVVSSTKQSIIFMPSNGSVKATMTTGANGVLLSGLTAGLGTSDAINVSQLTPVISALGGGATFNTYTGAVTGPSYTLANANSITGASSSSSQSTVGGAFNEVDAALGQLQTQISKLPLVDAVTYDSSSHSKVTLAGSDHVPVALTNVANGALNASSLDAVNGSQ